MQQEYQQHFQASLVAIVGMPLVGKTVLAKALESRSNYICIDVDEMRWEGDVSPRRLSAAEENVAMEHAYLKMHNQARQLLEQGRPVIVTATYSRNIYHDQLKALADNVGGRLKVFYLEIPSKEEIEHRLEKRHMHQEGHSNVLTYEHFASVQQRYKLIDGVVVKSVPAGLSLDEEVKYIFKELQDFRSFI